MDSSTDSASSTSTPLLTPWMTEFRKTLRLRQLALLRSIQQVDRANKNGERRQDKHIDWMYEKLGSSVRSGGDSVQEEDEVINLGEIHVHGNQSSQSSNGKTKHPLLAALAVGAGLLSAMALGGAGAAMLLDTDTDTDTQYEMQLVDPQ